MKEDYPRFWLPFLPKVFTGSGAAFAAGTTFFFSLFDVGITSFSVGLFSVFVVLPRTPVLLVPGYTLCACTEIRTILTGISHDRARETRRGMGRRGRVAAEGTPRSVGLFARQPGWAFSYGHRASYDPTAGSFKKKLPDMPEMILRGSSSRHLPRA